MGEISSIDNELGEQNKGMSLMVKTSAKLTLGMMLVYGVSVVLNAHNNPGGGFVAGGMIGLALFYFMIAFGNEFTFQKLNRRKVLFIIESGVALAAAGAILKAVVYFKNSSGSAAALIRQDLEFYFFCGINILICLGFGAGLFFLLFGLITAANRGDKK